MGLLDATKMDICLKNLFSLHIGKYILHLEFGVKMRLIELKVSDALGVLLSGPMARTPLYFIIIAIGKEIIQLLGGC